MSLNNHKSRLTEKELARQTELLEATLEEVAGECDVSSMIISFNANAPVDQQIQIRKWTYKTFTARD